jgi:hypothetical protein
MVTVAVPCGCSARTTNISWADRAVRTVQTSQVRHASCFFPDHKQPPVQSVFSPSSIWLPRDPVAMETEPSPSAYGMCKAFVFPHSQSQLVSDYEQSNGRVTSGLAGSLPHGSSFHNWPSLVSSPTLPGTHTASLVTQHADPATNVVSVSTCPKSLAGTQPTSIILFPQSLDKNSPQIM